MAKDAKKVEPTAPAPTEAELIDELSDRLEAELGVDEEPPAPEPFRHTGSARPDTPLPLAPSLPSIRLPVAHINQDGTVNEIVITDAPNKLELTDGRCAIALVSNDQAVRLANALVIAARLKWVQKVV